MSDTFSTKDYEGSYILNSRGKAVCQLLKTILEIKTTDQLHQLLRNLESPSSQWRTDDVRSQLAEVSAQLQAQEALIKALFALCPKRNPAQGFEPTLTSYNYKN